MIYDNFEPLPVFLQHVSKQGNTSPTVNPDCVLSFFAHVHKLFITANDHCWNHHPHHLSFTLGVLLRKLPQLYFHCLRAQVLHSGDVVELRTRYSPWASTVTRLLPGASHVEVEWTVGPIPTDSWLTDDATGSTIDGPGGKEVVFR